jgi:hypothetical protein
MNTGLLIRHSSLTSIHVCNRSQQCNRPEKRQRSTHLLGVYCRSTVLDGHESNLGAWPLEAISPSTLTPRRRYHHSNVPRPSNRSFATLSFNMPGSLFLSIQNGFITHQPFTRSQCCPDVGFGLSNLHCSCLSQRTSLLPPPGGSGRKLS